MVLLKNLFRIPDTFAPDDRRRRQVINMLMIFFVWINLFVLLLSLLVKCNCTPFITYENGIENLIVIASISFIFLGVVWLMNRSPRLPSWLTGTMLMLFVIISLAQSDTPMELYDGRSTIVWAIPIVLASVIFAPRSAFLVAAIICGMLQVFTPPDSRHIDPVNYYSMLMLIMIALTSWLGMSIAERAIHDARRQAANLQAIYDHVADGVLVLDLQGNFLSANPALLKMIPEQDLAEIIAAPLGKTVQWKRKIFSVNASAVPEVGTVAVFRDETRRHETERARDALLATASHELRTPLTAVMNYLELLLMLVRLGRVDTDEFKAHLERAIENGKRLQHLIDNVLDQAQIQAGVLELKPQAFNLRDLLARVRHLLDGLIQQKQLGCELEIAPDVPEEITGDPERLHQVLVNLVGNAIKFTNQGKIKINVSSPQSDTLSIEVADTGPGIPPEQLPDIFEAFRRGSNYAQRERQGAGLGLSIAKEIVTRMGGQLAAASQFGSGSTFTVTLPIEPARP